MTICSILMYSGEHVPIEEPDGIDDYYLYDASIDIITAIKALYNEDGSRQMILTKDMLQFVNFTRWRQLKRF